MKVLRFAMMASLVCGLTACAGKPTEKVTRQQGAGGDPGARSDDRGDADPKAAASNAASGYQESAGDPAPRKEQLVGTWEPVGGDAPPGTAIQFTDDGKMKMTIKAGKQAVIRAGTYHLEGHSLTMTHN